ncbi:3-dehydroquinate synthase [Patescibacteria group bacterium]|nr:3-dehydroquinate synthase [Patescibacteria group bacterium]
MYNLTVRVPAQENTYQIIIGQDAIAELKNILNSLQSIDNTVVLYDENVNEYAKKVKEIAVSKEMIPVTPGEHSKTIEETKRISQVLLKTGMNRNSLLINVGGGMLTDLAGFVASIYMRGIRCIHVPTTLLGMVDAAIGGKTGVDLGDAKNMIGHYHHPSAVIEDIDFLETLPSKQLQEGIVEVIKVASMLDNKFFSFLEDNIEKILNRDAEELEQCIRRAVGLKVSVIEKDERDSSSRLFLNFGHTVGHALEAASSFTISHGEAVAIGMVAEMKITNSPEIERVQNLLEKTGVSTVIPKEFSTETLIKLMGNDKKNISTDIRMTVPRILGEGEIRDFDPSTLNVR